MYRKISELRYRADFQERVKKSRSATGYVADDHKTWLTQEPVKIEWGESTESEQSERVVSAASALVTIRHRRVRNPSVTDVMFCEGKAYSIQSTRDPDGMKRQLELTIREMVTA